jgi:uncharacterized membrane protein YkgB
MSVSSLANTRSTQTMVRATDASRLSDWIDATGQQTIRYSLVVVLVWIGAMKLTVYEAEGIEGLVSNNPLMAWSFKFLSTRQLAAGVGIAELSIAGMIATRPIWPRLSAYGSVLAVGMFLVTLSFLFSTPCVVEPSLGFPALTFLPGQMLIKDLILLGAAIWTTGEALRASNLRRPSL